jgi:hypothetical protein
MVIRVEGVGHGDAFVPEKDRVPAEEMARLSRIVADIKDSNPKDAVGSRKVPFGLVPQQVIGEVALGMLEGALKYGAYNYRAIGVRASVYRDATSRHLSAWWEGQDVDAKSGIHHISKAIASLVVLRDAMLQGMCEDDRPPRVGDPDWIDKLNAEAERLIDGYPNPAAPFTQRGTGG